LLTVAIALPLVDDAAWGKRTKRMLTPTLEAHPLWRERVRLALIPIALLLALLGALQIASSLGGAPHIPESLGAITDRVRPFRFVNGYGLFAVMTTERREIVIEGSLDGREWREYPFRDKPRDPRELPRWSAPHMPRLDWQMWFAALGDFGDSPWLLRFMRRLLEGQPGVLDLLADDPFDGHPPRFVRARVYDYRFGDMAHLEATGEYWIVTDEGAYGPTLRAE
ncbi:MAG: lipase maturation factor family protein, partial [Sandaracinaceae bacterium]